MNLFPFFIDLEDKPVLIVGGGKVAAEKYEKLKQFTSEITIVAKESDISCEKLHLRKFEDADLEGFEVVICATDDRELNKYIAEKCMENRVLVNTVDDPELCSFIFPSLIKTDNVSIGVTSSGKSPLVSQHIRKEIEKTLPENLDDIIDELYALKLELKETVPAQKDRAAILRKKFQELI